jgi:hypothetical protein
MQQSASAVAAAAVTTADAAASATEQRHHTCYSNRVCMCKSRTVGTRPCRCGPCTLMHQPVLPAACCFSPTLHCAVLSALPTMYMTCKLWVVAKLLNRAGKNVTTNLRPPSSAVDSGWQPNQPGSLCSARAVVFNLVVSGKQGMLCGMPQRTRDWAVLALQPPGSGCASCERAA